MIFFFFFFFTYLCLEYSSLSPARRSFMKRAYSEFIYCKSLEMKLL